MEEWEEVENFEEEVEDSDDLMTLNELLMNNNVEAVRELLATDWTLIPRFKDIHYHAIYSDTDNTNMTKLLLSHGAPVDRRDRWTKETTLHHVCWMGKVKLCELFLTNGARYDLKTEIHYSKKNNKTPLYYATNTTNVDVVKVLISHGAEVTTDAIFASHTTDEMRQAMKEVYLPTKNETQDFKNSPLLNDLLSKPASLKNLCRYSLRKSMRILTEGRTIRPLVASLENTKSITWEEQKMPLPETLGNFLLCDPPVNWRKEMVIKIKSKIKSDGWTGWMDGSQEREPKEEEEEEEEEKEEDDETEFEEEEEEEEDDETEFEEEEEEEEDDETEFEEESNNFNQEEEEEFKQLLMKNDVDAVRAIKIGWRDNKELELVLALHIACQWGREKMCELILTNDARYDLRLDNNMTPLNQAANVEVVKALISHGATVDTETILGYNSTNEKRLLFSLKNLCRNSLRKSMRILTGGRTIRPLVAKLENLNVITWDGQKMPLPETLGNFLLCDPPVNWRKQMVAMLDYSSGKTYTSIWEKLNNWENLTLCDPPVNNVKADSSLSSPKKKQKLTN